MQPGKFLSIAVCGHSGIFDSEYGGFGSGGFDTSNNKNLYESLNDAGFVTNPTLKSFYESNDEVKATQSETALGVGNFRMRGHHDADNGRESMR